MPQLFAQPYDLDARGFYFEDLKQFNAKASKARNAFGQPVEEFELQFIEGDAIDCHLAEAWGINQASVGQYFDAADMWDDHGKRAFIIAVGEGGYSFDAATVSPDDFDIDVYHVETMRELAEQFVDEGLFGHIPDHFASYIDMDAIARDLAVDYTETEIAGERLIYRLG